MPTKTAQDEELLIIAEDESLSKASEDIEFSFDFDSSDTSSKIEETSITEEKSQSDIAEFSAPQTGISDKKTDDSQVSVEGKGNQESPSVDASQAGEQVQETSQTNTTSPQEDIFSFDVEDNSATEQKGQSPEVKDDAGLALENLGATIKEETVVASQENAVETETNSGEDSMNDILSATIAKLSSRKQAIAQDKGGKATKKQELQEQITGLKNQVEQLEADMALLDIESDKITTNISGLEKMKLDPVKNHNSKRVAKK